MLKQNKGITIIALAVTVIILIILISISAYSGYDSAKSSRYYEAITEIKMMQAKVNELYEDAKDSSGSISADIEYGEPISTSGKSEEANKAFVAARDDNISRGEYRRI